MSRIIKPTGPVVTEITLRWDTKGQVTMDGKIRKPPRIADITKLAILEASPFVQMPFSQMLVFLSSALSSFIAALATGGGIDSQIRKEGNGEANNETSSSDDSKNPTTAS